MSDYIERPRFSCALGGGLTTASALPQTAPVLHGSSGCAGNLVWTLMGGGGLGTSSYCSGLSAPSTNIQEREVVFGGTTRLREQIQHTLEVIEAKLLVVITGCVPEMIGDDVQAVVSEYRERGVDIVLAETGGFRGNSYTGYEIVLEAVFRGFVKRGAPKVRGRVNVWGVAPSWDAFWRGNLEGVRDLLERLGLTVNTFFGDRDDLDQIRAASSAELNIVLSDVYGVKAARTFEQVHGTPYLVSSLPIGPTATEQLLRQVADRLKLEPAVVNEVIAQESQRYYKHLTTLADAYTDADLQRYVVVVGDANYAAALPRFLADDLGWLPELVVFTDPVEEEHKAGLAARATASALEPKPRVVFDTDTSRIVEHVRELRPLPAGGTYNNTFSPAFVVGSSLDRELARVFNAGHLSVSFPVANRAVLDRGYTGYRGGLRLVEDLLSQIVQAR